MQVPQHLGEKLKKQKTILEELEAEILKSCGYSLGDFVIPDSDPDIVCVVSDLYIECSNSYSSIYLVLNHTKKNGMKSRLNYSRRFSPSRVKRYNP